MYSIKEPEQVNAEFLGTMNALPKKLTSHHTGCFTLSPDLLPSLTHSPQKKAFVNHQGGTNHNYKFIPHHIY